MTPGLPSPGGLVERIILCTAYPRVWLRVPSRCALRLDYIPALGCDGKRRAPGPLRAVVEGAQLRLQELKEDPGHELFERAIRECSRARLGHGSRLAVPDADDLAGDASQASASAAALPTNETSGLKEQTLDCDSDQPRLREPPPPQKLRFCASVLNLWADLVRHMQRLS